MDTITIEKLQLCVSPSFGAVLEYGEYVFVTDTRYDKLYSAKIYAKEKTISDEKHMLKLVDTSEVSFVDSGSAIKWCFGRIEE